MDRMTKEDQLRLAALINAQKVDKTLELRRMIKGISTITSETKTKGASVTGLRPKTGYLESH
jgi:hypothetical protein